MFSPYQIYDPRSISALYHHSYTLAGQLKLMEVKLYEQSHSFH